MSKPPDKARTNGAHAEGEDIPSRNCTGVLRQRTGQRMHQGSPLLVWQLPRGALQPCRYKEREEQLVLLKQPSLHVCKYRTCDCRCDVGQALWQGSG